MSCGCMYYMCTICSVCCHSSFTVESASRKTHQLPLFPPFTSLPSPPRHHPHSPPALPPRCLPPLPFLSPHCLPPLPVLSSSPTISHSLPLLLTACPPLHPPSPPPPTHRYFIPLRMRSAKDSEQLLQAITYIRNTWPWYNRTNGAFHFLFHLGELSTLTHEQGGLTLTHEQGGRETDSQVGALGWG